VADDGGVVSIVDRATRLRFVATAAATVTILAGCNLLWSDQYTWRSLWVADQTPSRVLITSDRMGWRFVIAPRAAAELWSSQHPFPADLTFLSADCQTVDTLTIAATEDTLVRVTDSGVDVITDSSLTPDDAPPLPQASEWPCE
jgi:hypothetical protein